MWPVVQLTIMKLVQLWGILYVVLLVIDCCCK